nr:linoleate 13S-lipoxygenase 3-1, chloroplastic-like [Tanacetum cinerariifolium]
MKHAIFKSKQGAFIILFLHVSRLHIKKKPTNLRKKKMQLSDKHYLSGQTASCCHHQICCLLSRNLFPSLPKPTNILRCILRSQCYSQGQALRQLSVMHLIYKLLDPHMRFTLAINAIAHKNLLNVDGVIQQCFTPGRYCTDSSVAAYKHWRFDLEGLPADFIKRVWQFQTRVKDMD